MPRCEVPEVLRVASRRIRSDFLPRRRDGKAAGGVLKHTRQRQRARGIPRSAGLMGAFQQPLKNFLTRLFVFFYFELWRVRIRRVMAGIAQLVEHRLPKPRVAGSNPVARSNFPLNDFVLAF